MPCVKSGAVECACILCKPITFYVLAAAGRSVADRRPSLRWTDDGTVYLPQAVAVGRLVVACCASTVNNCLSTEAPVLGCGRPSLRLAYLLLFSPIFPRRI